MICWPHRAGLLTHDEFLSGLSATIEDVQTTPGRLLQSVELASFDAWIRYYRPDENSANVSISYYAKGQLLAFLLDARIRRLTNGARSLDDVMRAAYAKYSGARGFTPDQFREVAEQVAGTPLTDFWNAFVKGTQELPYAEALATFGLRFQTTAPQRPAVARHQHAQRSGAADRHSMRTRRCPHLRQISRRTTRSWPSTTSVCARMR